MPDRRRHWEERYSEPGRSPGDPSQFLQSVLADIAPGRALDLACGDGRNALAMARRGHAVTAIDLAHAGLVRLRHSADDEGLAIDALQADLDSHLLPPAHFDLAVKILFLERHLFAAMKDCLVPGGIAVVETFLVDQRQFGHPRNPAFLLERGELESVFADFEELVCEEGLFDLGSERAYLSRIAARKPLQRPATE